MNKKASHGILKCGSELVACDVRWRSKLLSKERQEKSGDQVKGGRWELLACLWGRGWGGGCCGDDGGSRLRPRTGSPDL